MQKLQKQIIFPMADLLTEPEIIIVPERSFYRVPFAALPARRKVFIRDFQDPHRPFSDDSEAHSRLPRGLSQSDWCAKVVGDPKVGKMRYKGENRDRYRFTQCRKGSSSLGTNLSLTD